jgi:predicted RNA-binding protein
MKGLDEPLRFDLDGRSVLIHDVIFVDIEPDNLITLDVEKNRYEITGVVIMPKEVYADLKSRIVF